MNKKILFGVLAAGAIATSLAWDELGAAKDLISRYVENGEILVFETRYNSDEIFEKKRKELETGGRNAKAPEMRLVPYLMIDAKYVGPEKKTREVKTLWSLIDGEMVLNTDNWERTRGFHDALVAGASSGEFRVINALAAQGGISTLEKISKELKLEEEVVKPWIESLREKHLVVLRGNDLVLHVQDPKMTVTPETKVNRFLVTQPYSFGERITRRYSASKIEKMAQAAFGNDFTVKSTREVFLPIYSIEVINNDGSTRTTFWNGLNGERIDPHNVRY